MSASAFVAPAAPVAVRSQSAMSMTAQQQSAPKAFAAASAALLSAAPAFATEGTSEQGQAAIVDQAEQLVAVQINANEVMASLAMPSSIRTYAAVSCVV
eukprot:12947-Heterococcus_DN1.PRE.1